MGAVRLLRRSALAVLLLLSFSRGVAHAMPRVGQTAPLFNVVTTTGQRVSLESYGGQVLLLDFFASWCSLCRTSVPRVVELKSKYGRQGLRVLGLSVDDGTDQELGPFVEQYNITYPLGLAGRALQSAYGIRSVPVVFVVDRRGVVRGVFSDFDEEVGRSLELLIRQLLTEE